MRNFTNIRMKTSETKWNKKFKAVFRCKNEVHLRSLLPRIHFSGPRFFFYHYNVNPYKIFDVSRFFTLVQKCRTVCKLLTAIVSLTVFAFHLCRLLIWWNAGASRRQASWTRSCCRWVAVYENMISHWVQTLCINNMLAKFVPYFFSCAVKRAAFCDLVSFFKLLQNIITKRSLFNFSV